MAKFVKAWNDRAKMMDLLVQTASEADSAATREYNAAICIQSWFRGCCVRAYLAHLHASANVIQRNFRGHLGREEYRRRLEKCLDDMRFGYYQDMATMIQKNWRGYYVRKSVFNYRTYKEYLAGVMATNEIIRARIKEEKERADQERATRDDLIQELQEQVWARRHHYLLGTCARESIFRRGSGGKPHPFEEMMRSIHFAPPPLKVRRPPSTRTSDERLSKSLDLKTSPSLTTSQAPPSMDGYLPPLVRIQGPFNPPEKVKKLRLRPFNPTLRAATAYDCEELSRAELKAKELCGRIIVDEFVPFSCRTSTPYEPLLHTSSSYHGLVSCELEQFRKKSRTERHISSKPFRTVLRPLATFDELNSSY